MKKLLLTTLSLFALLFSGSLMATTYTLDGTTWSPGNPGSLISTSDSVILVNGANWQLTSSLTNNGVIVITTGTEITIFGLFVDLINNGTILLYGDITVIGIGGNVVNNGTINGTGTVSSFWSDISGTDAIDNSGGGTVNGNGGNVSSSGPIGGISSDTPNLIVYSGGNLGVTSCTDTVEFVADYTFLLDSNYSIGFLRINPGITITINSGASLTICGNSSPVLADSAIFNNGTIIVETGGSLVQTGANTNSGSGTYQVKQTGHSDALKYNIWSSPVSGAVAIYENGLTEIGVFQDVNACAYYTWDSSTQSWKYDLKGAPASYNCTGGSVTTFDAADRLGSSNIMGTGRGYFITGDGTSSSHTFIGDIHNGTVTKSISNITSHWNLIGNPYPSGLNADAFISDNPSFDGTIYFWDDPTDTIYNLDDDYASYNLTGGTPALAGNGGSGNTPQGIIGVAQGFWVIGSGSGLSSVEFNNAQRDTLNNEFYKKEINNNKHLCWVSVMSPTNASNVILVGYLNNTTDDYDRMYDGEKLQGNSHIKFASLGNDKEYAIQAIAPPVLGETKVVKLGLFTDATGTHTFAEYKRENIPTGVVVYLKDNTTNTLHDLTSGDYTVHLDGNQTYNTRFELIFVNKPADYDDAVELEEGLDGSTDAVTGVEDVDKSDYTLLNEANNYTLYNANGVKGDVQVVSITGTVVWTKSGVNATSFPIDLNELSSGIYFIQVIYNNERVYSNKVVNP